MQDGILQLQRGVRRLQNGILQMQFAILQVQRAALQVRQFLPPAPNPEKISPIGAPIRRRSTCSRHMT